MSAYLSPFSAFPPAAPSSQEKVVSSPSTAGSSPRHSLRYKTSEGIVAQLTQNFAARMETLGSPRAIGRAGGKARRISEREKEEDDEETEVMKEGGKVIGREMEKKEMNEEEEEKEGKEEEEEEEKEREEEEEKEEGEEIKKEDKVEEEVEEKEEEEKEEEKVEIEKEEGKEYEVEEREGKRTVEEEKEGEGETTAMDLEDREKLRKVLEQELTVSEAASGGGAPLGTQTAPLGTQTAYLGNNEVSWQGKVEDMGEEGEREGEGERREERAKQLFPVRDEQVHSEAEERVMEVEMGSGGEVVGEEDTANKPDPVSAGGGNGDGVKERGRKGGD